MEKEKGKKINFEPGYLMYLFIVPFFLIAIVPEGFFTWQVMLIFAGIMSIPFIVAWLMYRKEPDANYADSYIEHLKENMENHKKSGES